MIFPQQTFISLFCEGKKKTTLAITDNTTEMFQIQTLPGKDIIFIHSGETVGEEKGYFLLAVSFTALKVFLFLAMLRTWGKKSVKLQVTSIRDNLQQFRIKVVNTGLGKVRCK